MSRIGQLVQGAVGNSAAVIDVAGTAVQLSTLPVRGPHIKVTAFSDNQQPIVLGYGALTAVGHGLHFQELRAGDWFEFQTSLDSWHWFDVADMWINNDPGTGHAGDGVNVAKLGPE